MNDELIMVFLGCIFDECKLVDYSCKDCKHYHPEFNLNLNDPIHPILNIPMSLVSTK